MSKSIHDEALQELRYVTTDLTDLEIVHNYDVSKIEQALQQAKKQEQEHIEYSKKVQEQFANDTKRIGELELKIKKLIDEVDKKYTSKFGDWDDDIAEAKEEVKNYIVEKLKEMLGITR